MDINAWKMVDMGEPPLLLKVWGFDIEIIDSEKVVDFI